MKQGRNLVKSERSAGNCDTSAIGQLKTMKKLQVGATYPNVETALRINLPHFRLQTVRVNVLFPN